MPIALCEAKCKRCGAVFAHACLGESAYGEVILSTDDGREFLIASAWSAFAQKVSDQIPGEHSNAFWEVLASLADPVNGKQLIHAIVCPSCLGTELEYWGGSKVGSVVCADASFLQSERLSPVSLAERVAQPFGRDREA